MRLRFVLLCLVAPFLFFGCLKEPITPATALASYLDNGDKSFAWEMVENFQSGSATAYNLLLTSQQWREYLWKHQLTVIVPPAVEFETALLFITGGSNTDGQPNWKKQDHETIQVMRGIAEKNRAVVAILWQVPNQPLFGGKTEDEIISYTLHNYRQDKDFTWPLLFPMVKSAARAMDAVSAFAAKELSHQIKNYVVSGASKRGWTTWLTAASDPRVAAIAPMVIDVLNMSMQMDYQIAVWQDYSPQIQDYVTLEIPQAVSTPEGAELVTMIDPYSYRAKLTMPKMILMGTNDEYWVVDAIKHYLGDIPGDNSLCYTPNAGHDLGDGVKAFSTLSAFFGETLLGKNHPACTWEIAQTTGSIELTVGAKAGELLDAELWYAESADQDFREAVWQSQPIALSGEPNVRVSISFPTSGFKAFYVDLIYPDPNGGQYSKSTRMFVADAHKVL